MSELTCTDIYKVAIEISNQLHFRIYDRKNIPLFDAQVVSHLFFEIKVERKNADDFSLFSLISTATGTGKQKGKGMASLASTAASEEPPGALTRVTYQSSYLKISAEARLNRIVKGGIKMSKIKQLVYIVQRMYFTNLWTLGKITSSHKTSVLHTEHTSPSIKLNRIPQIKIKPCH